MGPNDWDWAPIQHVHVQLGNVGPLSDKDTPQLFDLARILTDRMISSERHRR